MLSRLMGVVLVLVIAVGTASGFEVGAKLRKVDVDKRVAVIFANGQERVVKFADEARLLDENRKDLSGGLSAKELKADAIITLQVEREGGTMVIKSLRLGGKLSQPKRNTPAKASVGKSSVGFKPLTEMTAEDRYKGEDGGLYGAGRNEMPDRLAAAASLLFFGRPMESAPN